MADEKNDGSGMGQDSWTGGHLTPRLGGNGGKTANLTGGHLSPRLGPKGTTEKPGGNSSGGQEPPKTKP
jgi:hypothetical protein